MAALMSIPIANVLGQDARELPADTTEANVNESAAAAANQLTADEQADGWLLLFDGETFFGWSPVGDVDWQIDEGVIRATEGEVSLLRTTMQFAQYRLKIDFRAAEGTNSGVFLHTSPRPSKVDRDCYELNIAPPDNPFPTGSFVGRKKVTPDVTDGEWHTFDIHSEGGHWTVKLNGQTVLEYDDPNPLGHGYIGLQHNSGTVEFRNVKLKPLGLKPIFNGRDLTGWKEYPEMQSRFTVTDAGELNVKNGRGQLETEGQYGDFVLQLDCRSNGESLNSGIFFRCMPGLEMMGYESQIQNGFRDGDRTKPEDCGTGGIFRRIDARRVVANDHEWFRKTLIAHGPRVAVWVNGYQVTDWSDQRKPHENPRKGQRIAPGTLMIQGHDETTDLDFRRIEISETPSRW